MKILIIAGLFAFSLGWAQTKKTDSLHISPRVLPQFLPFHPGQKDRPIVKIYPPYKTRPKNPAIARPQFLPFNPKKDPAPKLKELPLSKFKKQKIDSLAPRASAFSKDITLGETAKDQYPNTKIIRP